MSLASIGAVSLFHGFPEFSWESNPTSRSGRACRISGATDWPEAHQLSELVANTAGQTTIGDATGVQEYIVFDDALLGPFSGAYLLTGFTMAPDHRSSVGGSPVKFDLSAVYIGSYA